MRANPGGYIPPYEVVGRDALIQRLWKVLKRQSLVLTAERRIGKTSILRKMEAEPPAGKLPIFHELENLNTPSEFVQTVVNDVKEHLTRSKRIGRQVTEFFDRFGGGAFGSFKLPTNIDLGWKPLLTQTLEHLVTHQEDTLVFLWDEMPMMLDNIKRNAGEAVAMDVLNTLRLLRQMYPDLRMVYTGSIGLHHVLTSLKQTGYINAPTNDMHTVDVPPLSDTDAANLARRLLDGENIHTARPEQTAQIVAGAVDNHPFYIHYIVDALSLDGTLAIDEIVDKFLTDGNDPWHLRHYRDRIDYYYPDTQQVVLHLLDILATAEMPLTFDDLFNRLKSQMKTEENEITRTVLRLLQQDHYIKRNTNDSYQFRFPLIQRWWRRERSLPL